MTVDQETEIYTDLIGKTIGAIERDEQDGDDRLKLAFKDGDIWHMWHRQSCCECVNIKDVVGDLEDLIGSPLTRAEERSQYADTDNGAETWTFYEFATIKGSVTLSWYGTSNGYYSTDVSFEKV